MKDCVAKAIISDIGATRRSQLLRTCNGVWEEGGTAQMVGEGPRQHEGLGGQVSEEVHSWPIGPKRLQRRTDEHESNMDAEAVFKDKMSDDFCEQ